MTSTGSTDTSVLVIGAGLSGLCVAIELLRAGHRDLTILEKSTGVGGVWRENTYPGAGCDVPSPYYSFSYEPRTDWPMRYSLQPDILDYIRRVSAKYNVDPHVEFGVEVTEASFDTENRHWVVRSSDGAVRTARVLVGATGQLSRPSMPSIPGADTFRGKAFHSAQWDHGVDLAGKRVAVIGTGASAIQFVPRIQPEVQRLTLFQRSAQYILPKPDREYGPGFQRAFRAVPSLLLIERLLWWSFGEWWTHGIIGNRRINALIRRRALRHLKQQVPDRRLREVLTPDYEIGCKRALFANDYYPAVTADNVEIETTAIAEITPDGVRTEDGVEHPADVIIYSTGFTAQDLLAPIEIRGAEGQGLHTDAWRKGARAYLGLTVPGFPNLFLMYGPNTNLGTGSIIYMLERQGRYIRQAVDALSATPGTALSVRPEVEQRYDDEIQRRLAGTAWAGCDSWYRADSGRISSNWPGPLTEYSRRTRQFRPEDYRSA